MNSKSNFFRLSFKNCEFEGETVQNKPHNRGFAFFQSGNAYYGEWKKGLFEGNGIFIHFTGILIKGRFLQGKLDGIAEVLYCSEPKLLSLWKNGAFYQDSPLNKSLEKSISSKGFLEGLTYRNDSFFKPKDLISGFHDQFFPEKKSKFFGNWRNSKPNGLGFLISQSSIEIGDFKNGFLNGFGRKILINGNITSGEFKQNLLQGPCLIFEKENNFWTLNSYKNNEKIEALKEGKSEFPPFLTYYEENRGLLNKETLSEDFIERLSLEKLLLIYRKKENISNPIKVPIIEIESNNRLLENTNFSTVYSQIIDRNNPYNSPKVLTKAKNSPHIPIKPITASFSKSKAQSPAKSLGNPLTPIRNLSVSNKKLIKNQTAQGFFTNNINKSPMNLNLMKKPNSSSYKSPKSHNFASSQFKHSTATNFFSKLLLSNQELYSKTALFPNKKLEKPMSQTSMASKNVISIYSAKDSNPVFIMDDSPNFEKKPESPINQYVKKLRKEQGLQGEEKPQDFCREIEGVNQIIEAALTEDSNFNRKTLRKKSKSFGLTNLKDP